MAGWRAVAIVGTGLLGAVSCCLWGWAEPDWRRLGLDEFEVRVDEGAAEEAAFHKRFYRATRVEKHDPDAARAIYRELLAERPETAYLYFKLARLDARQRQLASCIENLEAALTHDPTMRRAYEELGRLYNWLDRDDELVRLFEQAVEHIKPDNIRYYLAIGELHERHGRTAEAIEVYERAIVEHPVLYKPWLKLFELRLDAGDENEAYETYQRALGATGGHRSLLVGVRELYREKHDEAHAFELTELLVERFPLKANFWYGFISALLEQGRVEEARAAFTKSCGYLHGETAYFSRIARLYEAHGDPDETIAVCERALECEPDLPDVLLALAVQVQARGELARAHALHERVLELEPANEISLLSLAQIDEHQGTLEAFGKWARRLAAAYPHSLDAQITLFRYYDKAGKREEADALLEKILGGETADPEACIRLGAYFIERGAYQRAREVTSQGLEATKRPLLMSHLHFLSGMADYAEHRIPEAARELEISTRQRPELAEAHYYLGLSYRRLARPDEAVKALERAVELVPDNPDWRIALGLANERAGRHEEAREQFDAVIDSLKDAVERSPGNAQAPLALAFALTEIGRTEDAAHAFQRAIELDPDSTIALNGLGYLWAEEGEHLDEALGLIERALEIDPESGAIVDSLGWVYFKMGRTRDALRELKQAVRLEPPTAEIYDHLADTYLALDDAAEAVKWWNKAIELYPENADAIRQKIVAHGGVPATQ